MDFGVAASNQIRKLKIAPIFPGNLFLFFDRFCGAV